MDKNRELHSFLLSKQNDIDDLIKLSTSNFSNKNSIVSFYDDLSKENDLSYFLKNFYEKKNQYSRDVFWVRDLWNIICKIHWFIWNITLS